MGTNYYVRKGIRPSKIKELKKLVNPEDIYNGNLQEALGEFHEIHIGKSSLGWQFCFDHNNGEYYDRTRKSINNFIQHELDNGGSFVDEYGKPVTLEEFWKLVDSKKGGFTQETAYRHNLEEWKNYMPHPAFYEDRYFKPMPPTDYSKNYPETITDEGLRFASYTDFS